MIVYLKNLILVIFISIPVAKLSAEQITLYVEDQYAPFSDKQGQGVSNQIIKAAFKEMGIEVTFEIMPFARLVKWLQQGKGLGGFNAVPTTEFSEEFIFGKQSIYTAYTYFYSHRRKPLILENEQSLDSPNLLVADVIGYMYHPQYKAYQFRRHSLKSPEQLIQMLDMGRVDAVYITGIVARYHIERLGLNPNDFIREEKYGAHQVKLHVAFNKEHPKAQYYADKLDEGLLRLKNTDTYRKIIDDALKAAVANVN